MRKKRNSIPKVALYFHGSIKACRDKLKGVLKYERLHGPWQVHLFVDRPEDQHLLDLRQWGADGIIMEAGPQLWTIPIIDQITDSNIQVVTLDPIDACLQPEHVLSRYSKVTADGNAIGNMGAEYFLDRGFKHFGFVDDVLRNNWSRYRREAFAARVATVGYSCHVYAVSNDTKKSDWAVEQNRMIEWLKSLPKPIGIMAAMDTRGRQILDSCMLAKIDVPHEIQVLGVDDDELICETAGPSMSSIAIDNESGGFRAAQLLDQLMDRKIRRKRDLTYQPIKVIERRSTEAVQFNDRFVVKAVEYIRINAGIGIGVVDIARHLKVSRRFLQVHFKETLGHSVIEEIMRARFNRVCTLLSESDLSIGEITRICGFENESYLGRIFKKRLGMTMNQFRRGRRME